MALQNPLQNVDKLLNFLGLGKTAGNVNLATMAPNLGRASNQANQQIMSNSAKQRQILQMAKTTKDPEEKRRLLQQSRDLDAQTGQLGESVGDLADLTKQRGNVSDADLLMSNLGFATKRGLQQSAELGSYAVPFGKAAKGAGFASKLATKALIPGAVSAGLQGAAKDDATVGSVAREAAGGALGSGLLHGAGGLLSKGAQKIGDFASIPALKALRPSLSQVTNFSERTGEDIGQFATRNKLFDKGTSQVNELIKPVQESFNAIANKEGVSVSAKSLQDKLSPLISEFKGATQKELQSKGAKLEEAMSALIKKYGDNIPLSELTKERKLFDKLTGKFGREAVDAETNQVMRDTLQSIIQESTQGVTGEGGRNLKELGQELNKLYSFKDIAKKQANLGRGSLPMGLTNSLGAGAGLASGFTGEGYDVKRGLQNAAIGGIAPAVINNPKLISAVSQAMSKVGQAGKTQIPQLLQNVLMQGASRTGGNLASPLVENQPVQEQTQGQVPPETPQNLNAIEQQTNQQVAPPSEQSNADILSQMKQFNVPEKNIQEFMAFAQQQGVQLPSQQPATQGMTVTPEMMDMATLTLAPKELAKLEKIYNRQQGLLEKKKGTDKLAAGQVTALADFDIGEDILTNLESTLKTYENKTGPIRGRISQRNVNDPDAQGLNSELGIAAQVIGKALEGGKLAEGDIARYKSMLPAITDTPATAKKKIDNVRRLLQSQKAIKSQALSAGGYDLNAGQDTQLSEEEQALQMLSQMGINLQ